MSRAEKAVTEAEAELDKVNALLASPAYSSDYVKAQELSGRADALSKRLESLYAEWERAEERLAELKSKTE